MHTQPPAQLTSHRREVRTRLLAAAEQQLEELGFAATSPADVSLLAGIGRTTFYEYFSDMEDVLVSLVEQRMPEVTKRIVALVPHELPMRDQLAELAVRMVEFAATDHVLGVRLHQDLPALRPDIQARIGAAHRSLSAEFARIYTTGVAQGELRSIPPDLAGLFLRELVMAAAKTLMNLDEPKSRLHEVADELVRFLLHGLDPV